MYLEIWEPCARCGGVGWLQWDSMSSSFQVFPGFMRDGVVVRELGYGNVCHECNRDGKGDHPGYVRRLIPLAEALAAVGL